MQISDTYQALYGAYPDAVIVLDAQGVIQLTNERADNMFGYQAGELQNCSITSILPAAMEKSQPKLKKEASSISKADSSDNKRIVTAFKRNKKEFLAELALCPLKINGKDFLGAFARELTVQETQQTRFQYIVDEVQDYAILFLDTQGNITNWNNGIERLLGYAEDEVAGRHFRQLHSDKDQDSNVPETLLNTAIVLGRTEHEGWLFKKNKSLFWSSVISNAIKDDKGHLLGFSIVIRDLTERMAAEEQLRSQSAKLVAKNKELESFAYIASHDLQEPLSTITGMIELIRYEGASFDEETESYFSYIESAIAKMRILIKGLLEYARLGRNKELKRVAVKDVINNVLADFGARIQDVKAQVEVGPMPEIDIYKFEFPLVFQNLISNALKFTKEGVAPEVKIQAAEHESYWEFTVSDNGIGIQNEALEKIFIIFQQLNKSTKFEGYGIGLSHCKKIIEMHQGTIWAESNVGKGTVFHFTIAKNLETVSEAVL